MNFQRYTHQQKIRENSAKNQMPFERDNRLIFFFSSLFFLYSHSIAFQVRGVEVGIVVVVLLVWAGAIALFFNRWGKIRMLLPYQPDYKQEQLKVPGTGVCSAGTCNGQHSHQVCTIWIHTVFSFARLKLNNKEMKSKREEGRINGEDNKSNTRQCRIKTINFSFRK